MTTGVKGDNRRRGTADVSSPNIIRHKLLSASSSSRASDSGISAEFSEFTCNGSSNNNKDGGVLKNDGKAAGNSKLPLNVENPQSGSMESPAHLAPCDSRELHMLEPPSSAVTSANHTTHNSVNLDSSSGSASMDEMTTIMNKLIAEHLSKDRRWEPSGRYHANLPQFEENVGNQLQKKKKAREDARKVLELFLEDSLKADPNFNPSGLYKSKTAQFAGEEAVKSTKHYVTSESSSPTGLQKESGFSPDAPPRPLSPIPRVESATERNDQRSFFSSQRNSYYDAIYFEQRQDDNCIDELTDAIELNVRLASEESTGDLSPIPLIPVSQARVTEVTRDGGFATTEVEATLDGIHIHKHKETIQPLSSSTSLSSILDDGGMTDLRLTDRKKKSIFKRASERLIHAFHRQVERSESRSESEATHLSVRPRKPKKKKKKRFGIGRKKSTNLGIVDSELLRSHQHKLSVETTAHIDKKGLSADLWRDSGLSSGIYRRSVQIPADRSQTLPALSRQAGNGGFKPGKKKEPEKAVSNSKAETKKSRKTDRTESGRSNDSMFRFLDSKKSMKSSSPARERKGSFGLSSLIQRNKKKSSDESKSPFVGETHGKERQSSTATTTRESLLRPPSDPSHLTSRSAEEITAQGPALPPTQRPSLRLTPQHSRSRSAQDTTSPFAAPPANLTTDSSNSSQLPSSSPTKQPVAKTFKSVSSATHKRNEIPRPRSSMPSRTSSSVSTSRARYGPSPPVHRHEPAPSGIVVASAGMNPNIDMKDSLDLPLSVDASVSRTQSLGTKSDGKKVLRTVTSLDEMVSLGERRPSRRSRRLDVETDSEIERIIHTPQADRTSSEKDQLYKHIAHKLTRMVSVMESDEALSSSFNTPMEDHKTFYVGNIPAASQSASSSGHTPYYTARSGSSSPSYEVTRTGSGPSTFQMAGIPETDRSGDEDGPSLPESQITETNIAQLGAWLRNRGDIIHATNPQLGDQMGKAMLQGIGTYEVFEKLADDMTTNNEPYIQRVAGVFSLTLKAIRYVGRTGELASMVKENALSYIENRLANYIIRNGGWDSVLEESSSEID